MPAILDVHDVTVAYHRKPVLWDVDLELHSPQLAAIVGPNGAGKSTLIKSILGLVPMASGRVEVFGQPMAKSRHRIGYVPQRESVDWSFPVSVLEVVLMGTYGKLGWFRRPGRAQRELRENALLRLACRPWKSGKSASFPAGNSSVSSWLGRCARGRPLFHG